jgi:integrase
MANKPTTNTTVKGKNYFRVRAFVGFDDKGQYVYKNFYGTSKSDAENKRNAYLKEIESGLKSRLKLTIFSYGNEYMAVGY